jgi:hypothetical protein
MSKRTIFVLAAVAALAIVGFVGFRYVTDDTPVAYATYSPPPREAQITDEQRIFALQNDLGNAASEMAQLPEMAKKLQFGKMKAMGQHLQEVAAELEPRLDDIENKKAKAILASGIDGLLIVGQGSEELDPKKSMKGVNQVLESFDKMRELQAQ